MAKGVKPFPNKVQGGGGKHPTFFGSSFKPYTGNVKSGAKMPKMPKMKKGSKGK